MLGDFGDVTFAHGGPITRFLKDGEAYLIETEGADGVRRANQVVGVVGVHPLQQYLLSPAEGRLQAYDIAWDVERKRWFPVFGDQVAPPGDGFHWTGPYKSWEARCAECHATGYSRNYIPATNSYAPRMAETGVGCEPCHGPGANHVAWAREGGGESEGPGLTVDLATSQRAELGVCLACHSRRKAMGDGLPLPGADYHDACSIALLREGVYHPDGAILDEVFEGGSFLQSRMHTQGVRCSNCHEPHSGALRLEGNAVCAQCHSPAGNPDFPTLARKVYDDPAHHFHPEGGPGAQCVDCHMIQRTYMGVDRRRDHSFRVPRPDLAATGSPDACTDCHADRGADWAAAELAGRFPNSAHRGPHFATVFAAARRDPALNAPLLLDFADWATGPGIVRATALDLLGEAPDREAARRVAALLSDPDPLVRAAAALALRSLPPGERLKALAPLLSDPLRSVREAAARALLDAAPQAGSPAAVALEAALAEWREALRLRADFPETHLQIGGAALTMRDFRSALAAFREAVRLDPQLVDAWSILIRLQAALGDAQGAVAAYTEGIAANPGHPALLAVRPAGAR